MTIDSKYIKYFIYAQWPQNNRNIINIICLCLMINNTEMSWASRRFVCGGSENKQCGSRCVKNL